MLFLICFFCFYGGNPEERLKYILNIDEKKVNLINIEHKYSFLVKKNTLRFWLKCSSNDLIEVKAVLKDKKYDMNFVINIDDEDWFYIDIPNQEYLIYFKTNEDEEYFLGKDGITTTSEEAVVFDKKSFFFKKNNDSFIVYSLIVDRFRNEYPYNKINHTEFGDENFPLIEKLNLHHLRNFEYTTWDKWFTNAEWEAGFEKLLRKFGGDLQGILTKLDHFINLNVDYLYINSPFRSYSYHKFDVIDFNHISGDICLGDFNDDDEWNKSDIFFSDTFIKSLHEKGLKLIISFPLTLSIHSKQFMDVLQKGDKSEYFDWFFIENFSQIKDEIVDLKNVTQDFKKFVKGNSCKKFIEVNEKISEKLKNEIIVHNLINMPYKKDHGMLTVALNLNNKDVQNHLISAMKKWILGFDKKVSDTSDDDGIDGIIFDYCVSNEFIEICRKELSQLKNIFIGADVHFEENIENSSLVFNYDFSDKITDILLSKTSDKNNKIRNLIYFYNLLFENRDKLHVFDSWNKERTLSSMLNKNVKFKSTFNNPNYKLVNPIDSSNNDISVFYLLTSFLNFFLSDIVMIYYGSEFMEYGGSDPDNRKQMKWLEIVDFFESGFDNAEKYDNPSYYKIKSAENLIHFKGFFSFLSCMSESRYQMLIKMRKDFFLVDKIDLFDNTLIISFTNDSNKYMYVVINLSSTTQNINLSEFDAAASDEKIKIKSNDFMICVI